jgi:hypothetical protein
VGLRLGDRLYLREHGLLLVGVVDVVAHRDRRRTRGDELDVLGLERRRTTGAARRRPLAVVAVPRQLPGGVSPRPPEGALRLLPLLALRVGA